MEKLPEDLLSIILIRLPAKLLAQMRCVSKPLNAFLTQPSFTKSHLNRSIYNNKDEILLVFNNGHHFASEPFTAHRSQSPGHKLTDFIKFPFNYHSESQFSFGQVIGSVNGLVCLSFGRNNPVLHIWNPSLSAVTTLPPFIIPFRGDTDTNTDVSIHFRFGFDPKTDDYKVVKLVRRLTKWLQVEIYSMRNGSWKLITERVPLCVTRVFEKDEVCEDGRNGHLHWLGCIDEAFDLEKIVAFDLGDETFSVIPLPDYIGKYSDKRLNATGVLAGKLCVMSSWSNTYWVVWVMNEYGVADSWVVDSFLQFLTPTLSFGFTLNSHFLFETSKCLALCKNSEAHGRSFKSLPPFGRRDTFGCRDRTKVVVYVDSLVWVAPSKNVKAAVSASIGK